jgi:hypothetical protein
MPVWQGQGSSIRRNASLARPRIVNQEECQSGKVKVCRFVNQEECQSGKAKPRLSVRRNASQARPRFANWDECQSGLLMSRGTRTVRIFWALLVSLFTPIETFVFYNLVDDERYSNFDPASNFALICF